MEVIKKPQEQDGETECDNEGTLECLYSFLDSNEEISSRDAKDLEGDERHTQHAFDEFDMDHMLKWPEMEDSEFCLDFIECPEGIKWHQKLNNGNDYTMDGQSSKKRKAKRRTKMARTREKM